MTKINLTKEECYTSFDKFYETLYKKWGGRCKIEDLTFKRDKVTTSFYAMKQIFNYYMDVLDAMPEEFLLINSMYGPANQNLNGEFVAYLDDGWVVEHVLER